MLTVVPTFVGCPRARISTIGYAARTVSLAIIAAGMVTSFISGDPRFLLAKESFLTATFGLACFGCLLMPRPLMFYFGRQVSRMGKPAMAAGFDAGWQYPFFRHVIRLMTVVWGCGYVMEALLRAALLAILPTPIYLVVSQGLGSAEQAWPAAR